MKIYKKYIAFLLRNIKLPQKLLKGSLLYWSTFSIIVVLLFLICLEVWSILFQTFTSEITGNLTKRAIIFPSIAIILGVTFLLISYITKRYKLSQRYLLIIILLFSFIIRLVWIIAIPTQPNSDFQVYHQMAMSIVSGKMPSPSKPLGYPLILSIAYFISPNPISGRILNVILGVITVFLVYTAGKLLGGETAGLFAASWMAISPSEIFMSSVLGTEVVTSTFVFASLSLGIYYFRKEKVNSLIPLVTGLILGIAVVIRPTSILYVILLAGLIWFKNKDKNRLKLLLSLFGGLSIILVFIIGWQSINAKKLSVQSLFYDSYPLLSGTNIGNNGRYNLDDVKLYYSWPPDQRNIKVFNTAVNRLTNLSLNQFIYFIGEKMRYYLADNRYGSLWAFYTVKLPLSNQQLFSLLKWIDVISQSWYFLAIIGTALTTLITGFKKYPFFYILVVFFVLTSIPYIFFEVQPRYHHVVLPVISLACGILPGYIAELLTSPHNISLALKNFLSS